MARVSWDIAKGVCEREGLDNLAVRSTDKKSRIYEATGAAEVLQGIEDVRSQIDGDVLVEAWKSGSKRADGYAWTCGNGQRAAIGGIGSGGGPSWETYMDTRIQLETLKLRNELEPKDNDFGELFGLLKVYAPAILAAQGVKVAPAPAPAPVNATPLAEEVEEGGLSKEELTSMMREVATFAKRNPDAARAYMDTLRGMNNVKADD